ncbi:MAG: hypothetical protein AB1414_07935 [bacterium]
MTFVTIIRSIVFILINISIFLNAIHLCSKYYMSKHSKIDSIISLLVLYIGQIILFSSLLGAINILSYYNLVICFIILYLIIYLFIKEKKYIYTDFYKIYNVPQKFINYCENNQILLVLLILLCSILLIHLKTAILELPKDGDSIGYHIPMAVGWLKEQTLYTFNIPCWFYPGNSELLTLWLILPFRNDVLIGLQNWIPFLICLLSIFSICKKLMINTNWIIYGIVAFSFIHPVTSQLITQQNDILVATFFISSLNFMLIYYDNKNKTDLLLYGISMGLLLGCKYSCIYYFIVLLIIHIFLFNRKQKISSIINDLWMILFITLIFGGFWYIRNWIITGSPIYPEGLSLLGFNIFKPIPKIEFFYDLKQTMLLYYWNKIKIFLLFLSALKNQGGVIYLFSFPIVLFSLVIILWQKRKKKEVSVLLLAPILAFLSLLITPLCVENVKGTLNQLRGGYTPIRYGLPFFALVSINFSFLMNVFNNYIQKWLLEIVLFLFILISIPDFKGKTYLVFVISIFIFLFFVHKKSNISDVLFKPSIKRAIRILSFTSIIILGILITFLISYKIDKRGNEYGNWLKYHFGFTGAYSWFDEEVKNKNVKVTGLRSYPFYGAKLENNIVYDESIPIEHIDYYIVGRNSSDPNSPNFGQFDGIDKKLNSSGFFIPVYIDNVIHIYKNTIKNN